MGMLQAGRWTTQDQPRANSSGAFVRPQSSFRSQVSATDAIFPAVSARYHLFANAGCPWAFRALLYRSIKNLTSHIGVSLTRPAAGPEGWTFGEQGEGLLGAVHLHEVYTLADPDFTGRVTVPVLWDTQQQAIVNNESADIIRIFNSAFDSLVGVTPADYYPVQLALQIDQWNEKIYPAVNNGVYRCGFAQSQQAYDLAFDELFTVLDELDDHLAAQRFLCGSQITEADWRLFATLTRFDTAYYGRFRCNRNLLTEFANLWPYTRDLYQQPGVADTVDFAAIKGIYYGSAVPVILPKGPRIDFSAPANRG